jgi:hypothetical protein
MVYSFNRFNYLLMYHQEAFRIFQWDIQAFERSHPLACPACEPKIKRIIQERDSKMREKIWAEATASKADPLDAVCNGWEGSPVDADFGNGCRIMGLESRLAGVDCGDATLRLGGIHGNGDWEVCLGWYTCALVDETLDTLVEGTSISSGSGRGGRRVAGMRENHLDSTSRCARRLYVGPWHRAEYRSGNGDGGKSLRRSYCYRCTSDPSHSK